MTKSRSAAFDAGQRAVLEQIATGASLPEVLTAVVQLVEAQAQDMACSILLVDPERAVVHTGAAPSLPDEFSRAFEGAAIGPEEGSCGAAAYRAERVVVKDIETHPYWRKYKVLALPHGLRACWSSPIFAANQSVLGTFAMYYRTKRGPTKSEIAWVDAATHLAAVAIQHDRTQTALRHSEERLRAVIEHTPNVAIQLYDREGRVVFCNHATQQIFGWNEVETVGKSLEQLNFAASETARFRDALNEVARTGTASKPLEFEFVRPDGRAGAVLSTVFRIPANGSPDEFVCMDMDLTDFRQMQAEAADAQKLQKLIYDNVSDVIFLLGVEQDDTFRFLSVNPAFLRSTGLPEASVVGRTVAEVIPEPSRSLALAKYRAAIARGKAVTWEETTQYPSGVRYGEVAVAPLFDAKGTATRLVGTVHDITGIRKADEERRQLELQFQHAQRMQALGTLVSGVAHDFNNILSAMAGQIDLALSRAPTTGPLRETLDDLNAAQHRAKDLVRQILDFSRKQEPRRELVSLPVVVEEALHLLRATLPKTLVLRTRYDADAPPVFADPTQVHQCVMNLGMNAVQATRSRAGIIEIAVENAVFNQAEAAALELAPGRYAAVRVTDQGCGMAPATLARIFDPFFTTKAVGEGTGLGLSVVRGILKNHAGGVQVQSELGVGTTFHLYFPTPQAADKGQAADATRQPGPTHGAHILYVDDDPALAKLAALILRRCGHRVTAQTDPRKALEVFLAHPQEFAAVVADISMPELTGPQLLEKILQIRPDVRTVLVSGDVTDTNRKDAEALGIHDVLLKPAGIDAFQQLAQCLFPGPAAETPALQR